MDREPVRGTDVTAPDRDPGPPPLASVPDDRDPELTKEHISTVLSTVAILAIVVGLTWGLWPRLGPWSLMIGGGLLAVLVVLSDTARRPIAAADPGPAGPAKPTVPGPSDPGNMHAKGPGSRP